MSEPMPSTPQPPRLVPAFVFCCLSGSLCMYYSVWLFPIYGPLFLAALVMGVLAMTRARIWGGLALFLTASILPGILFVVLLVLPSGKELQTRLVEWREGRNDFSTSDQIISLGESARTPAFDIKVATISQRGRVGSLLRNEKAGSGTRFLVVTWYYENITDKPVPARDRPDMTLVGPDGSGYSANAYAGYLASGRFQNQGLVGRSLNPGIRVRVVNVFEVPRTAAGKGGWKAMIAADERVSVHLDKE